jgi:hypothetical protein
VLQVHLDSARLRRAAYAVEKMMPGGTERPSAGRITADDLRWARAHLRDDRPTQQDAVRRSLQAIAALQAEMDRARAQAAVYLSSSEHQLPDGLRSSAIEVAFVFGDRDGTVSQTDLRSARSHYGNIRGPVGWNRNLTTDELERRLFPGCVLSSAVGRRLEVRDWLGPEDRPMARLPAILAHIDDGTLARTFAATAARLGTLARRDRDPAAHDVHRDALMLMGQEITRRGSMRPTLSDIARIGSDDAEVAEWLRTPIDMARLLLPQQILDPFLGP